MPNMKSVTQSYNPNLLSEHTTPVALCLWSYYKKSEVVLITLL